MQWISQAAASQLPKVLGFWELQSTAATSACYLSAMAVGCLHCHKAELSSLMLPGHSFLSVFLTCVHPSFSLLPHSFLLYLQIFGRMVPCLLYAIKMMVPFVLLLYPGSRGYSGSLQEVSEAGSHFSICLDATLNLHPQLDSLVEGLYDDVQMLVV